MFRSRREFFLLLFQGNEVLLLVLFSREPYSMGLKTEKEGRKAAMSAVHYQNQWRGPPR